MKGLRFLGQAILMCFATYYFWVGDQQTGQTMTVLTIALSVIAMDK